MGLLAMFDIKDKLIIASAWSNISNNLSNSSIKETQA